MSDEEEDFRFLRQRNNPFDSTVEENLQVEQDTLRLPNSACPGPITSLVYIDDYNNIEKLCLSGAQSHICLLYTSDAADE